LLDRKQISLNAASEIAKLAPADQDRVVRRIRSGELKGDTQVYAAVDTILNAHKQPDIFGKPEISEKETEQLSDMERRIQAVEKMVATGWKDGECITAFKVDPNRAKSMAEKIKYIRSALLRMETALYAADAQRNMLTPVGQ